MDIEEIRKAMPHRYPFLLVDRILKKEENRAVGLKNVTANEPFFQGHFPGNSIMPGVLIIEAMAQVVGCLIMSRPENIGKTPYFLGINKAKFRYPVVPGDQLVMEVEVQQSKGNISRAKAVAKVGDKIAAETEFLFGIDVVKRT